MTDSVVDKKKKSKLLVDKARDRGYLSTDDVLATFPKAEEELEELEEAYLQLVEEDIPLQEEAGRRPKENGQAVEELEKEIDLNGIDSDDLMRLYLSEVGSIPLLSAEEELALARRLKRGERAAHRLLEDHLSPEESKELEQQVAEGRAAQEHLVNANSRLVISIAKRYMGQGEPLLDLIQEGNLGLITAVRKFDPQRGYKLSTYATWWIRQAITRAVAGQGRSVRLPVHTMEDINRLRRTSRRLEQELGRRPAIQEIAEAAKMPVRKVEHIFELSRHSISLDTPVGEEKDSTLGEFVEDAEARAVSDITLDFALREEIEEVLNTLTPREARILRLRFGLQDGHSYTLQEVGQRFGLTRERIRQIEAEALQRLRHPSRRRRFKAYEPS